MGPGKLLALQVVETGIQGIIPLGTVGPLKGVPVLLVEPHMPCWKVQVGGVSCPRQPSLLLWVGHARG